MSPRLSVQSFESQTPDDAAFRKGPAWTSAATEWAHGVRQTMAGGLYKASRQTETYVQDHPGTMIATAACMGLAAGWFLGWGRRKPRP